MFRPFSNKPTFIGGGSGSGSPPGSPSTPTSALGRISSKTLVPVVFGGKTPPGSPRAPPVATIIPLTITLAGFSVRGKRKHDNEDRVAHDFILSAVARMENTDMVAGAMDEDVNDQIKHLVNARYGIIVDGHGGDQCASFVHESFPSFFVKASQGKSLWDPAHVQAALEETFDELDNAFETEAGEKQDSSGACATAVLVHDNVIDIANIGDCRCIAYINGETRVLSVDHRVTDPGEKSRILVSGGVIINGRLDGVLAPSRSFGDFDIKCRASDGVLISQPHFYRHVVDVEDLDRDSPNFILACTDGVWDVLSNHEACQIVSKTLLASKDANEAAKALVQAASHINPDDVSALVIQLNGGRGGMKKAASSSPFLTRMKGLLGSPILEKKAL